MPIQDFRVDFSTKNPDKEIVGRRELLSQDLEGNWTTTFKGKGMEFTGYRRYTYTDDASFIDWRASLRSRDLLVREFEEYRNFNILFLFDVSDTMLFSSHEKLKAEFAAEFIHALTGSAGKAGEAVGLYMFSDKLVSHIQPNFGVAIRKRLEINLANGELYGGKKDFKRSLLQTNALISPRCIVVVVSDFLALGNEWESYLVLLSKKHDIIGVQIKDPRDRVLPSSSGQFVLQDPNSNEQLRVDNDLFRKKYAQHAKDHEEYISQVFKRLRGRVVSIDTSWPLKKAVDTFFTAARQGGAQ